MTTIRQSLGTMIAGTTDGEVDVLAEECLTFLGIDPDLPAEWATVDRCIDWLRERGFRLSLSTPIGAAVAWLDDDGPPHYAPTLHAALIAACRAVQKAQP